MTVDVEKLSFEAAFKELEGIVDQLESGDLPIDQAVDLYEAGARLVAHCGGCLDRAELRIKELVTGADGELAIEPLPFPR
jgi:exodeoxyribonuclease VII small subunit